MRNGRLGGNPLLLSPLFTPNFFFFLVKGEREGEGGGFLGSFPFPFPGFMCEFGGVGEEVWVVRVGVSFRGGCRGRVLVPLQGWPLDIQLGSR